MDTWKPTVSVVIPNYNHARYLGERLESVLNQTYQHFEVLILDDCSTDNSREVIEPYRANPHVSQIIYNEANGGGVFRQWEKGIRLAKGELVWIAESDDKCEPTFLETLVGCFGRNKDIALAFCKSLLFNDEGKTWTMDTEGLTAGQYDSHTFVARFMSRGCPMLNASACLFSREAFDRIDNRYTQFRASGDRMFWTFIAEQGGVAVVDERLNWYRKHETNVTKNGFQNGINQRETKLILDYIFNKGYISQKTYRQIRRRYLKKFVFELLTDSRLKKDIYQFWGYNYLQQQSLRLEAYYHHLRK